MRIDRRAALRMAGGSMGSLFLRRAFGQQSLPITPGPFVGTRDSLARYQIPDWFADAKFGIWSHWGPQSAIGDGDWYARLMYIEGSPQYRYHLQRFGPQSKIGYKDLIPLFTADRWDPDALIDSYVKAGAKYFVSMGVHHDNYDMWNSKYQARWNTVASGPRKDIVGLWAAAARKKNLRFGVSEHLSNSFDWYAPAHGSDADGPYAHVPYDGADPAFADLYHSYAGETENFAHEVPAMGRIAPESWKQQYFRRIKDLIDQHHPDLLYTDGGIPFDLYGLALVAEQYNLSAHSHEGRVESVYNSKVVKDCGVGTCVLDRERKIADGIWSHPWQTDTCIGEWHYKVGKTYKSAKKVIDLLIDIVSKNGNLLLNFPLPASGELDHDERMVLNGITEWMAINGEGIFGSRPWETYGEGPSAQPVRGEPLNEDNVPDLTDRDLRFTKKNGLLYVFAQGSPQRECVVTSLGRAANSGRVAQVEMLGIPQSLKFIQAEHALQITPPDTRPASSSIGVAFRVRFA